MKFRDLRRRLKDEGWIIVYQSGSHQQWKHPGHPDRRVTLAGHDRDEVKPGTLISIFKQARWKR